MNWLKKLFFLNNAESRALQNTPESKAMPSAVEYVDWLLAFMLRTGSTELTIDSKHPLPGTDEKSPSLAPPCLPTHTAVFNRLKLLSGLNPVVFAVPQEGRFEKQRPHSTLTFLTRFSDESGRSTCVLRMRIGSRHGQSADFDQARVQ